MDKEILDEEVQTWLSLGPSSAMTFYDEADLISLTWIHERVGNETLLGIRVNHAQVDYIGMMIEEAHVRFISIINLDDDGTPSYFVLRNDSGDAIDSVALLKAYGFIPEKDKNDRWVYFK